MEKVALRIIDLAPVIHLTGDDAALQHRQHFFPVLFSDLDFLRSRLAVILHGGDHGCRRVDLFQSQEFPHADSPETVRRNAFRREAVGRPESIHFPVELRPHELIQRLGVRIRILEKPAAAHPEQDGLCVSVFPVLQRVDRGFVRINAGFFRCAFRRRDGGRPLRQFFQLVIGVHTVSGGMQRLRPSRHAPSFLNQPHQVFLAVARFQVRLRRAPDDTLLVNAEYTGFSVRMAVVLNTVQENRRVLHRCFFADVTDLHVQVFV